MTSTTICADGGRRPQDTRVEQSGSDRAGTVSNTVAASFAPPLKQWLLVGGPGNGLKRWHDVGLFIASLPDPTDPAKVHYYAGRQVELDGARYQLGIHEDVFDDVELTSLIRASGLRPFQRGES